MRKIYYCFRSPFAVLSKATKMMYRVIWEEKTLQNISQESTVK